MGQSKVGAGKRSGEGCEGHAKKMVMGQTPDRGGRCAMEESQERYSR